MKYGYMRVSTAFENTKERNQSFDRQLMILKEKGIEEQNIYQDRISGGVSTKERPQFDRMFATLKKGDVIYVSEMSRFSRSLQDLIESVNVLIDKKIGVVFIKEGITIDENGLNPMNKFIFQLFGAFAEFEKSLIAERVHQGMQASKARGTQLGRKNKITKEQENELLLDYTNGMTLIEIGKKYGITRQCASQTVARLKGVK